MNLKGTIILCEDEYLIALDIKNQLVNLGYKVLKICKTGEDLVNSARELRPDIIITDIQLKGNINGIDAIKIIRQEIPITFFYLSGQQNRSTLEEALDTKPAQFIGKPFTMEQLRNALESCITATVN